MSTMPISPSISTLLIGSGGGEEVTIASIFSGTRDRAQDAIAYATAVGARWVGYGFDERISKSAPFRQPFHFRNPRGRGREEYLA
jgi:hypothetical protein